MAPLLIILSPVAEQDAECAPSHSPTWVHAQSSVWQDMGVHYTGECSDEDLLCSQKTPRAPVLCQAVVAVWRVPPPFVLPSACCTSTSPAACLPAGPVPQGPRCRCGLQTSKGPIQTESVWLPFVYVKAIAQLSNVVVTDCG